MKIFVVGDIHMGMNGFDKLPALAEDDLLILNGDLTNFGGRDEASQVLERAMSITPNVLAQFGNLDRPEVNDYLDERRINLHGQARLLPGPLAVAGVGGSNQTPFRTPSEFTEEEMLQLGTTACLKAQQLIGEANEQGAERLPLLLISHTPPYETAVDRIHSGAHVGSTAIRQLIETFRPDLCICGHIHEARNTDRIAETRIANPGMLATGGFVRIIYEHSQLHMELL
ncbi:MAG: serine/threonine protein phosphatase [Deltaproteobacteria bacterium]|nr:MAG: serine/threonine protein phosphatase [Deltaproteobacteria bacterium]